MAAVLTRQKDASEVIRALNDSHDLCQGGCVSVQGQKDASILSRSVLRHISFLVCRLTPSTQSAKVTPLVKVTSQPKSVCHKTDVLVLNALKHVT